MFALHAWRRRHPGSVSMVTCICVPPLQDDFRQMDEEVWAFLANFSSGRAGSPPSSSSSSSSKSSSSSSSSSSRRPSSAAASLWSLRSLSPPSPPSAGSGLSASRPPPSSPSHAPRLQVDGGLLLQPFRTLDHIRLFSCLRPRPTEQELRPQNLACQGLYTCATFGKCTSVAVHVVP